MRGLLRKDLYMVFQYGKWMIFMAVLYGWLGAMTHSWEQELFWGIFAVFMFTMLTKTIMAYDERSKWDKMAICFPISRKTMVWEKYVFAALCGLTGVVLYWISTLLLDLIPGLTVFPLGISHLALMLSGSLLISAVELPIMLHFGIEKGRIWFTTAAIAVVGGLGGFAAVSTDGEMSLIGLLDRSYTAAVLIPAVILFLLSMLLSVKLYEKKEM